MAGLVYTGNLSATGGAAACRVDRGGFNLTLSGTFVATIRPERSFDGGATWLPLTALGTPILFTTPCSEIFDEPEIDVQYRVNCTSFTSGTISWRISQ